MSEEARRQVTTFDRLAAIVDGGHLAEMTGAEAKALLVYLRYADFQSGEAYPAMETIAEYSGTSNVNRARRAVKGLIHRGIVSQKTVSNGRATVVRKVECPPKRLDFVRTSRPPLSPTRTESVPVGDHQLASLADAVAACQDEKRPGSELSTGPTSVPVAANRVAILAENHSPNPDGKRPGSILPTRTENVPVEPSQPGRKSSGLKPPNRDAFGPSTGTESVPRTDQNISFNTNAPAAQAPRRLPTGDHAALIDHFVTAWAARYSGKYPFGKIDGANAAKLLKHCGSLEAAKAVIDRYLANHDKFYDGHPLSLLMSGSQLPRFIERKQSNGSSTRPSTNRLREGLKL